MNLEELESELRRRSGEPRLACVLDEAKSAAVTTGDEVLAKRLWCLEQVNRIHALHIQAHAQLRHGAFYPAWCTLEQIEIALGFLGPHLPENDVRGYGLDFIGRIGTQVQQLYPYRMFMSPEIIELEKRCNICNNVVRPRSPCGHRVGEVYQGELCIRVVTEMTVVGTSFVRQPMQKYSVVFPQDGSGRDPYDYSVPAYLAERWEDPFASWEFELTKTRHPHARYSGLGRNALCPCDSGRKYKKCCLPEREGVLRPHYEFKFHFPLDPSLERTEYSPSR